MQFPNARILIFAKAPVSGQVKTRLIPCLGEQGALDLYLNCLYQVVEQRCRAEIAPVVLYCMPDSDHRVFQQLRKEYSLSLKQQKGGDLGERMLHAVQDSLVEADSVILTGVDAPALTNQDIQQGICHLARTADVVMNPAEDGGYVMLGLKKDHSCLFLDIPWGTAQVSQITRQRCAANDLTLSVLPMRWDIDRPEDMMRFASLSGSVSSTLFI